MVDMAGGGACRCIFISFSHICLTLQFDDFFVGDDVHLIKSRVVFGHVLVLVLFLLFREERAIDCETK